MKRSKTDLVLLQPSDCCCPKCGSKNIQGITRITGYLSLDERFGEGKVNERASRVDHNGSHKKTYSTSLKH